MSRDLAAFIDHARAKGMDHATIRMLLLSAGWKEKDVVQALTETTLDLPVPVPPETGGAREAFFHLLTFAAFYSTVIAVVILLFWGIDGLLPDPAAPIPAGQDLSPVRWSLAMLIVTCPVFLWLSRFLIRELAAHPEKAASGVRRWLTYLTLLVAAVVLGGNVIALVFQLLEGGITVRFVLKALVILLVSGLSFAYYLLSLQLPPEGAAARQVHRAFGAIAGIVVLGTLVWGFVLAGSPAGERLRKLDERRVEDLRAIRDEIVSLCAGDSRGEGILERPLPASLEDLVAEARFRRPGIRDPQTGEPYGYEVVGASRFRLCAAFSAGRDESFDVVWNHPPGRHCFEIDALRPG